MTLEQFLNQVFYQAEDSGASNTDGKESGDNQSTDDSKETDDSKTQDPKPYKTFSSEDDYNKELQSARSKAKHEMLKELGVEKMEDAKAKLTSTEDLAKDLGDYKTRFEGVEEELALTKTGVKDEYKEEALTLAKSKMKDGKSLSDALGEVVKKMPSMASGSEPVTKVGTKKGESNSTTSSQAENDKLKQKYPWLKL